jgi:hypothetical protein
LWAREPVQSGGLVGRVLIFGEILILPPAEGSASVQAYAVTSQDFSVNFVPEG